MASQERIRLDLGEEEKHYGGERLSVNGSLEKTLKTLKTLKVNVSEEGKKIWNFG